MDDRVVVLRAGLPICSYEKPTQVQDDPTSLPSAWGQLECDRMFFMTIFYEIRATNIFREFQGSVWMTLCREGCSEEGRECSRRVPDCWERAEGVQIKSVRATQQRP